MKKVFVVVVTYNGAKWIEHCLRSVYESTIEINVVVVDNGSLDETLSIINNKYPQTKVLKQKKNRGFGRANNIGIRYAIQLGANYIYLLNQDAWVSKNCIENLIQVHGKCGEYGILSPLQLTGNANNVDSNFMEKFIETGDYKPMLNDYMSGKMSIVYETGLVMAAHWLLYVPDLQTIGLFSPAFSHYGEDYNLISRYKYYNKKVGICPNALAFHDREYRKTSPEKLLYIKSVVFLRIINDPNKTRTDRYIAFAHFIYQALANSGTSIWKGISFIYQGFKAVRVSSKYRKIYTSNDCYSKIEKEENNE